MPTARRVSRAPTSIRPRRSPNGAGAIRRGPRFRYPCSARHSSAWTRLTRDSSAELKRARKPGFLAFVARAGSIASASANFPASRSRARACASRECREPCGCIYTVSCRWALRSGVARSSAIQRAGVCPSPWQSRPPHRDSLTAPSAWISAYPPSPPSPMGASSRASRPRGRAARRLRVAQRALARKKRGSGGCREARVIVARCHAAVARRRREHLHQASARLVRDYDAIAVEKLNVKGLAGSALAKDVHDASWAKFISMLRYKAEKAGARFIEVDPHNTSQECSGCGRKVPKDLAERRHDCLHCGLSIDRDINAARNILNRAGVGPGLRNVAGRGMRAGENLDSAPRSRRESVVSN